MAETNTTQADAEDLEALFQRCMQCQPAIDPAELNSLADLVFDRPSVVRPWRIAAWLGSKGGDFFSEVSEDEGKAKILAPTIGVLEDFAQTLRDMANLADTCRMRLAVAGCNHEDFSEWEKSDA